MTGDFQFKKEKKHRLSYKSMTQLSLSSNSKEKHINFKRKNDRMSQTLEPHKTIPLDSELKTPNSTAILNRKSLPANYSSKRSIINQNEGEGLKSNLTFKLSKFLVRKSLITEPISSDSDLDNLEITKNPKTINKKRSILVESTKQLFNKKIKNDINNNKLKMKKDS